MHLPPHPIFFCIYILFAMIKSELLLFDQKKFCLVNEPIVVSNQLVWCRFNICFVALISGYSKRKRNSTQDFFFDFLKKNGIVSNLHNTLSGADFEMNIFQVKLCFAELITLPYESFTWSRH